MPDAPLPHNHSEITAILLDWFEAAKRPLPWRTDYDPYRVLVSEIMLQQTQMDRATEYFNRWMERFPDIGSLAEASPDAVLKAWEGLGYYSRAKNLQRTARALVDSHGSSIPSDPEILRGLPGIGPYTAGAIASIAFNRPVAAVDANVERVFSRLFDIDAPVKSFQAADLIQTTALAMIPEGRAREFNQALMEFGALICSKRPKCDICPLNGLCMAKTLEVVHERPIPGKKTAYSHLLAATGVLVRKGRFFIQKRPESGLWANFWEFPGGKVEPEEMPDRAVIREFMEETEWPVRLLAPLGLVRHAYTRYRITLHCYLCALDVEDADDQEDWPAPPRLHAAQDAQWVEPARLRDFTFPAGHRKLIETNFGLLEKAARDN